MIMEALIAKEEIYELADNIDLSAYMNMNDDNLGLELDGDKLVVEMNLSRINTQDLMSPLLDGDSLGSGIHNQSLYEIFRPMEPLGPPERGVFAGALNFEVQVNSSDVNKRKYLYSQKLNRIFVDMGSNFSMQFRWDFDRASQPMLVRATTVFTDVAQAEKRVERCLQHKHSANAGDPVTLHHVLRSTRETTTGVHYCGDHTKPDSWYSVLVEYCSLPDNGSPVYSHAYQFVCKNSCSSGINRRAIDIVFTLEDRCGLVYGRHTVGARVCACPRRDMIRDEETEAGVPKKRVRPSPPATQPGVPPPPPVPKRMRMEVNDEEVYTLPAGIQIVGSKTLTTGFTVMKNMMEQMASYKTDPKDREKFANALQTINLVLSQCKST